MLMLFITFLLKIITESLFLCTTNNLVFKIVSNKVHKRQPRVCKKNTALKSKAKAPEVLLCALYFIEKFDEVHCWDTNWRQGGGSPGNKNKLWLLLWETHTHSLLLFSIDLHSKFCILTLSFSVVFTIVAMNWLDCLNAKYIGAFRREPQHQVLQIQIIEYSIPTVIDDSTINEFHKFLSKWYIQTFVECL